MELQEIKSLMNLMESSDEVNRLLAKELIKSMTEDDWNLFIKYNIDFNIDTIKKLRHGEQMNFSFNMKLVRLNIVIYKIGGCYTINTTLMNLEKKHTMRVLINNDIIHHSDIENITKSTLNMYQFSKVEINNILNDTE